MGEADEGESKTRGLLLPAEPGIRMDLSLSIFLRFITFHFALVLAIIFLQFNSPMPRKITKARRLPNYGQARRGCSAVSVRETFPCEHVGSTCSPKAANGSLSESSMNLQTAEFSSLSPRRLITLLTTSAIP